MIKIFGSKTSPFTRKVRIVALEKKLDWSFECFDPLDFEKFYLGGLNPLGRVPVMMLNDNIVVFDSPVIAEYLDNLTPNKKLITANSARENMMVRRWEALADGLCDIGINSVVYESRRITDKIDENRIITGKKEILAGIELASKEFGNNEFCMGQSITLGDIALLCALDWIKFRIPDIDWQDKFENINSFYQKMLNLPSIIETSPY